MAKHNNKNFWAAELKRFHELIPSGKILEIGTGGSRDAKELIKLGYGYIGTDISSQLLKQVRMELPSQELYLQSVYELSFPGLPKFDGFWASKVLLHIPKSRIDEVLQRIKTVVRPGGGGFISLKDGNGEGLEIESWGNKKEHKRFFSYWSKEEFAKALNRNQFTVVDYIYRPDSQKTRWHCFFVEILKD